MGTWKPKVSWGLMETSKALPGVPRVLGGIQAPLWGSRALKVRLSLVGVWKEVQNPQESSLGGGYLRALGQCF